MGRNFFTFSLFHFFALDPGTHNSVARYAGSGEIWGWPYPGLTPGAILLPSASRTKNFGTQAITFSLFHLVTLSLLIPGRAFLLYVSDLDDRGRRMKLQVGIIGKGICTALQKHIGGLAVYRP